ncbi:cryptochrome/photolyase family protein [Stappia sp.]|uniref:cryptochrome/photolyase family protein n=1 Tax=Stappia sp. TaxID=1870903 RepID=UPI003A98EFDE
MPDTDQPVPILVWFREDLRLDDNPALAAALSPGSPVVAVYVREEGPDAPRAPGGASRWWLHHSLTRLSDDLKQAGIPLVLRRGPAEETLRGLAAETGASRILWNRRYDPAGIAIDTALKAAFKADGVTAESFSATLIAEPWELATGSGGPYRVFSPFFRALIARGEPAAPRHTALPAGRRRIEVSPDSETPATLFPLPTSPDWAGGLRETWEPGEAGALRRLETFLDDGLERYAEKRDEPASQATSLLSPHLRFGEISPRRIWHAAAHRGADPSSGVGDRQVAKFHSELGWREFSYHLLYHFPKLPSANFQSRFDAFPWRSDDAQLRAWTKGLTGYPLVDAGMRELWHTGYMHNRVRMVTASFLIKHLMIDWREGEAWFRDTLVDADPASNAASWQWVAGSGADAAPYFRIFNPTTQGEKFDPDGTYTKRWVPELSGLPQEYLFKPHEAPREMLSQAGIRLGDTYPRPIVDHKAARQRALDAFQTIKNAA